MTEERRPRQIEPVATTILSGRDEGREFVVTSVSCWHAMGYDRYREGYFADDPERKLWSMGEGRIGWPEPALEDGDLAEAFEQSVAPRAGLN